MNKFYAGDVIKIAGRRALVLEVGREMTRVQEMTEQGVMGEEFTCHIPSCNWEMKLPRTGNWWKGRTSPTPPRVGRGVVKLETW